MTRPTFRRRSLLTGSLGLAASATVGAGLAQADPSRRKVPVPAYRNKPRDPYHWPFAADSIWNMPLGSNAHHVPINMTPPTEGYAPDETYLVFDEDAPLRRLIERDYWWPWVDGDEVIGVDSRIRVHVPDGWLLRPPGENNYPNRMTAMIQSDGLVREFQYTVRPTVGSDISFFEELRAVYDIKGDGLTGPNGWGAHGGSGMTGIGGTLRAGDLTSPHPIRHALNFTVDMQKWGTADGGGYRWPAIAADNGYDTPGWTTGYGSLPPGGPIQMGSLLALPPDLDLDSLGMRTVAARKIAAALQGWGAYVTDTSVNPGGNWDVHMIGADEDAMNECPDLMNSWGHLQTPLRADLDLIFPLITLVDNNGPDSIGGGGRPIRPLAPRFA